MHKRTTVVIACPFGRLGNRLLLFANFIGAALEHDLRIVNPAFATYAGQFPATAWDALCRFPARRGLRAPLWGRLAIGRAALSSVAVLSRLQSAGHDVGLIRISLEEGVDLNGEAFLGMVRRHRILVVDGWYFRNDENCLRHRDQIRAFLTPYSSTLARAQRPLLAARTRGRTVVGVHIRRGDYRTFRGGRYYYSHSQYGELMRSVAALSSDRPVTFLVCSDEPVPPGAFNGLDVALGTGVVVEDLYGLAACDLIMGPPSTFSRWAAFYGGGGYYVIEDPTRAPTLDDFRFGTGLGRGSPKRAWVDRWSGT